jgi:hypothetical protein
MSLFLLLALSLQPPPPEPVQIRPGATPEGTSAVPISEVAEPLGLAFASFDADHDGRTSRSELDASIARTFAAADTNGDRHLGYIEYSGWATTWLGSATALPGPFAIDTDGDNRLSREEMQAEFGREFDRLDKDRDGAVTHAELLTVRNPRLQPLFDRNGRRLRVREQRREGQ